MKLFKEPFVLLLLLWLLIATLVVGVDSLMAAWEVPTTVIALIIGYSIMGNVSKRGNVKE